MGVVSIDLTAEEPAQDSVERDYQDELPRLKPQEPDDALATFRALPGFRIEQVAAEPLVVDPIAIAFDADGRMFVVEMRGYSEDPDDDLGRIRMLTDVDGDGRFDKASVYLDGLSWPTAVACYDGGIFVAAAPELIYAKDTDDDGVADQRRVVYTGFGRGNVQGLVNTFKWGLDNRMHGATSSSGASLVPPEEPDATPLVLRGRDFALDPRTDELIPTSGGGQHGLSFDRWGRKFVCSNSDHCQQVMFEDRYLARNPYLAAPGSRRSIAQDGPQAEVFRISPVEPWRIVRTRLRVKGVVKGPVEGGGRAAGYFTGATGITIYRGNAWPEELLDTPLIGDVGSNIIHRKMLDTEGIEFRAFRADEGVEFIGSSDIWFRPAQMANGPDGSLYVCDMYREVIEHPLSLPPVIKKHLDLTSGRDRGRIYRIVPEGFQQPDPPRLSRATSAQLVATLEHTNGWHRETAQRLLYERQDQAAVPLLEQLARESTLPEGRMHALYTLDGLDALSEAVVLEQLQDEHPRVREHAVRLSESLAGDSSTIRDRLYRMTGDSDPRVRYQLAFSLGQFRAPGCHAALTRLAKRDAESPWLRLAVLSSLSEGSGEVFAGLIGQRDFRSTKQGQEMLNQLVIQIGLMARQDDVTGALKGIELLDEQESKLAQSLVASLSQGLAKAGSPLQKALASSDHCKVGGLLKDLLDSSRKEATDAALPVEQRVVAIGSLPLGSYAEVGPTLAQLLDNRQPHAVQQAALAALGRFDGEAIAEPILAAWPGLSPRMRIQAGETLSARPAWLSALIEAVAAGQISPRDLEPARIQLWRNHADPAVKARAAEVFVDTNVGRRSDVVKAYAKALELDGDLQRGKQAFKKNCSVCHKVENVGVEIGPNLAAMQNRGPETILVNVLDPNREVNPQFLNYALITQDGRSITGILDSETATSVTLRRAENASDTVLRINIDALQSTGLSIMPEGLEKEVDQQTMADLIAYLMSIK
jgi:putative membrane-bound dehydrogenase-like protein